MIGSAAKGAAVANGALTTTTSTTLPAGGPYHMYWNLRVVTPGNFSLLYGSGADSTNLATPVLFDATTNSARHHHNRR